MRKTPPCRIQDLLGVLHGLYPQALAESWDNVGLHLGEPEAEVRKVLICLDPDPAALARAAETGAQVLLSHHPLIFHPLKNITSANSTGRILLQAARDRIALICAHTNLDRARNGLNDWLAECLGLQGAAPLQCTQKDLLKLVVFVPGGYEDEVAAALFAAGAGHIGRYDCCSFQGQGTGTFRPGEGTDPFVGRIGALARAAEIRLETVVPQELLPKAIARMRKAHPYEEPAYDVLRLENRREHQGLGRIGSLESEISLRDFVVKVRQELGSSSLRFVGPPDARVRKVALCGGSGASLIGEAIRQGADVLVTADVKYHEAKSALEAGLCLVDAGHFATERLMVPNLRRVLGEACARRSLDVEFVEMQGENDPFCLES